MDSSGVSLLTVNDLSSIDNNPKFPLLDVKGKIEANDLELTGENSTFKANTILTKKLGIGIDEPEQLQADLQIQGTDPAAETPQRPLLLLKDHEATTQFIVTAEGNVAWERIFLMMEQS